VQKVDSKSEHTMSRDRSLSKNLFSGTYEAETGAYYHREVARAQARQARRLCTFVYLVRYICIPGSH